MDDEIIYPSLLIIFGILVSTVAIILLTKFSNRIVRFFQLYPESRGILSLSLKFISWFVGIIIFLLFLRLALRLWGLEFTTGFVEDIIEISPRYIVAMVLILAGAYVSRTVNEKSRDYDFEFKNGALLVINFIIYMTFLFTALYSIGVDMSFFIEFYKAVLWTIGAILALVIGIAVGIPIGMGIYERAKKSRKVV
jgi:hypothetical protein